MPVEWIASAAFGLEGLVKKDLTRLGAEEIRPLPTGGVAFSGDLQAGFRANMWLRSADRVLLVAGRFEARSFEDLFEGVRAVEWEKYIPRGCAFPVRAQCARSTLMSPSDCQSITKKAIAERLKAAYGGGEWLEESGAEHAVDVAIREDIVTVSLDTSGAALNRRGYRTWNGEAPLRETLAASLALLSPWRPKLPLFDPCCGTGTILIEAAFIASDRAPGLTREFSMEKWPDAPVSAYRALREEAQARYEAGVKRPIAIEGGDIDPAAVELARRHIRQAGLEKIVRVTEGDLRGVTKSGEGVFIANPPYGERMGDRRVSQAVARQLGEMQRRSGNWALCAITADRSFEKAYGRRADRRRRLYNGRLECEFMIFDGNHGGASR